jgi:hypothetical protein
MPFLLPTESELLLPVLKQREADWAGSTQLQPIKLKLPLMLVNDKENSMLPSIYISKLRYRRGKFVQKRTII